MYIYLITNTTDGSCYVGKTTLTPEQRWRTHCATAKQGSPTHIHRAIRKYGQEAFRLEILEVIDPTDDLNERECSWISELEPSYNMTPGGDGGWIYDQTGNTWTVSEEGRQNMRESRQRNREKYKAATEKAKPKLSGANNYQSKYTIHTPWGIFYTWKSATDEAKRLKQEEGRKDTVTDIATLKSYCHGRQLNSEGRRTLPKWRGQHTHDIGFYVEER